VTILIVFLATTNIAIGYAIAVYLGHGQLPWRLSTPLRQQPPASPPEAVPAPAEQHYDDPEELATVAEEASEAAEPIEETAEIFSADEVETTAEEAVVESAVSAEEPPVVAEEKQKTVEPEAGVTEAEPATGPAATVEASEPESEGSIEAGSDFAEQEQSAVNADEKLDEKFLEGLADFQNQLKQEESTGEAEANAVPEQTAPSKEPVAEVAEEKVDTVEPEIESQEEASISDEVLAGIESFRDQLANMQQQPSDDTETTENELTEQPVEN